MRRYVYTNFTLQEALERLVRHRLGSTEDRGMSMTAIVYPRWKDYPGSLASPRADFILEVMAIILKRTLPLMAPATTEEVGARLWLKIMYMTDPGRLSYDPALFFLGATYAYALGFERQGDSLENRITVASNINAAFPSLEVVQQKFSVLLDMIQAAIQEAQLNRRPQEVSAALSLLGLMSP